MLSVNQTNAYVSRLTIFGWWAGLAWHVYTGGAMDLNLFAWAILIIGGMFVVSLIIGGGIAFLLGVLTRVVYGDWHATSALYAWGTIFGPVIAFFCASPAIGLAKNFFAAFGST